VAAVAVGDGPVYPVLFRVARAGRLDHSVVATGTAHPSGPQGGSWWRATRLRAGTGCYGLQIDGRRFSEVLVVQFA
jgi:hypothetical protein